MPELPGAAWEWTGRCIRPRDRPERHHSGHRDRSAALGSGRAVAAHGLASEDPGGGGPRGVSDGERDGVGARAGVGVGDGGDGRRRDGTVAERPRVGGDRAGGCTRARGVKAACATRRGRGGGEGSDRSLVGRDRDRTWIGPERDGRAHDAGGGVNPGDAAGALVGSGCRSRTTGTARLTSTSLRPKSFPRRSRLSDRRDPGAEQSGGAS